MDLPLCITILMLAIPLSTLSNLSIRSLHDNPVLLIKIKDCKIQSGSLKIIHPINISSIQESVDYLITAFYDKPMEKTPLEQLIKYKIKTLYNNLVQITPMRAPRQKRWEAIGTAWKWIAGSPDAQDLRVINSTMNELVSQNNQQYNINNKINGRIAEITESVNKIIRELEDDKLAKDVSLLVTMANIDILNGVLENIQDAITLSKQAIIANRILTIQEINNIKTLLQDEGIDINLPDEALRHVVPKFATSKETILYILHVPKLTKESFTIIRIYPLIQEDHVITNYPKYVFRDGNTLYTTNKPDEFVQKSEYLTELTDSCFRSLIFGTKASCNATFANSTSQTLIEHDAVLIQNAKNHTLRSNCGPDDRKLNGNFVIEFNNCSITFNEKEFRNSETTKEINLIYGAFHETDWNRNREIDIPRIKEEAMGNRKKLEHVYLKQFHFEIKLWSLFGLLSLAYVVSAIVVAKLLCNRYGSGRSSFGDRAVTERATSSSTPTLQPISSPSAALPVHPACLPAARSRPMSSNARSAIPLPQRGAM